MFGQIYIEKDNVEVYRTNNNIHPQFKSNLGNFVFGTTSANSVFNNSANWVIDRFLFYQNKIDTLTDLSVTGIGIGTKNSVVFNISNYILNVKISYTVTNNTTIASLALASQYQTYSYANVNNLLGNNQVTDYITLQAGETIVFAWQLDMNNFAFDGFETAPIGNL